MEEAKVAQTVAPPPQPPPNTKKRALDITHLQNYPYYKMRAIVKDLRPHFIQVLQTPDFRNCNAANEIREKVKVVMALYKEITAETIKQEESKNVLEGQSSLSGGIQDGQKPREHQQNANSMFSRNTPERQQTEDVRVQGTYVVGGSAFGWNFITFPGGKAVYYGRTKEAFRSVNPKSQ